MFLPSKIWKIAKMFFCRLEQYGYRFPMEAFLFFFSEYSLKSAHFYLIFLIFSVLVIIKY